MRLVTFNVISKTYLHLVFRNNLGSKINVGVAKEMISLALQHLLHNKIKEHRIEISSKMKLPHTILKGDSIYALP